ncbi:MAG TPA: hypothetical protein VKA97_07200, partial [Pyrinomonadaceae bacterium]|nr:hypothetical protein [Pyrinomonadaceae bacterium]
VETEPQTPTVMIKRHRKYQRHHKEYDQDIRIIRADNQQAKETNEKDNELRRDDVCQNRAYKKAVLTLKKRHAMRAVMPDVKRGGDDL